YVARTAMSAVPAEQRGPRFWKLGLIRAGHSSQLPYLYGRSMRSSRLMVISSSEPSYLNHGPPDDAGAVRDLPVTRGFARPAGSQGALRPRHEPSRDRAASG